MTNTDPVSGLMASLSRVRQRGVDGSLASQAGTAAQAGTVQAQPKAPQPMPLPAVPQAQAAPQAQVVNPLLAMQAQAVPTLQTPPQTPSEAPISPEDIEVTRLATLFRRAVPEFPQDVALALAAQYLDENTVPVPTQPGQTLI
jgi:hypothetical protein